MSPLQFAAAMVWRDPDGYTRAWPVWAGLAYATAAGAYIICDQRRRHGLRR